MAVSFFVLGMFCKYCQEFLVELLIFLNENEESNDNKKIDEEQLEYVVIQSP